MDRDNNWTKVWTEDIISSSCLHSKIPVYMWFIYIVLHQEHQRPSENPERIEMPQVAKLAVQSLDLLKVHGETM